METHNGTHQTKAKDVSLLATFEHWEIPNNRYFTAAQIENRFGIAANTLANWRVLGKNLVFHKDGNFIRYPLYGRGSVSDYFRNHSSSNSTSGEHHACEATSQNNQVIH